MANYQAIYQVLLKAETNRDEWLDYAREPVAQPDDCIAEALALQSRMQRQVRVSVENWDRGPTTYYGDWDKRTMSPAEQETGVFKPLSLA